MLLRLWRDMNIFAAFFMGISCIVVGYAIGWITRDSMWKQEVKELEKRSKQLKDKAKGDKPNIILRFLSQF